MGWTKVWLGTAQVTRQVENEGSMIGPDYLFEPHANKNIGESLCQGRLKVFNVIILMAL